MANHENVIIVIVWVLSQNIIYYDSKTQDIELYLLNSELSCFLIEIVYPVGMDPLKETHL